jgi:phosphatidylcholine synthase
MDISSSRRVGAWAVHLLTASGAVCGLLSLAAIGDGSPQRAFAWMFAAVLIDAVDGYLARQVGVASATAGYDGALLDNLVDYLNYAVVPAFFVLRLDLLGAALATPTAALIVLASAYQFAQVDAKTDDNFFRGFPSYWNIAVFYLHYLALGTTGALIVVLILLVATFVPTKWAYPTRMTSLRGLTLALGSLWGGSVGWVIWSDGTASAALWGSLAFVGYYVGVSRWLTRRDGPRPSSR